MKVEPWVVNPSKKAIYIYNIYIYFTRPFDTAQLECNFTISTRLSSASRSKGAAARCSDHHLWISLPNPSDSDCHEPDAYTDLQQLS